jgi:type I restriction enzyme S subunit
MGKYQAYPSYKSVDSEYLPLVPSSWRVLRGKYVFNEFSERSTTGEEELLSVSEYFGVRPRGDIVSEGDFISRAESLVDYKKCFKNDLVMNIMLAWKCGLGVTKFDGIVSPAYSVFRFNDHAVPDYMHYLLRTRLYNGIFKARSTGVIDSRLRLYPEAFGDISILLPSRDEQIAIAAFLDHETAKIDALIEKQQQLIQLLKEKRQAVISHAVTKGLNPNAPMKDSGIEWLGEVPAHWNVTRYKFCTERVIVGIAEAATHAYTDVGVPIIRSTNIKEEGLDDTGMLYLKHYFAEQNSSKYLSKGDVITVRTGYPGISAVVPDILDRSQCFTNLVATPRKSYCPQYLAEYLNSHVGKKYFDLNAWGSAQKNISVPILQNFFIATPPLEEQLSIKKFVDDQKAYFKVLINNSDRLIDLMQERRTALISAAVTGKIDVRNFVEPATR